MRTTSLETVEKLREQALRCRRLAGQISDRPIIETLLQLAGEFEQRALALEQAPEAHPK